jgi:hypothetical protein
MPQFILIQSQNENSTRWNKENFVIISQSGYISQQMLLGMLCTHSVSLMIFYPIPYILPNMKTNDCAKR